MQGIAFARRLAAVVGRLGLEPLVDLLEPHLADVPNHNIPPTFASDFARLLFQTNASLRNEGWTDFDEAVIEHFQLHTLLSEGSLHGLIGKVNQASSAANLWSDHSVNSFYSRLGALTAISVLLHDALEVQRLPELEPDQDLLEVVLSDYDEGSISPWRLTRALESLQKLGDCVARLLGIEAPPLRIAVIDSGSDIIIILVGLALVIGTSRELLSEVIDRARFKPNELAERNFETLQESLTTLRTIEETREEGVLSESEAKSLRHSVLTQVRDLIGVGLAPADQEEPSIPSTRQFLLGQRSQRLLGSGEEEPESDRREEVLSDDPDAS